VGLVSCHAPNLPVLKSGILSFFRAEGGLTFVPDLILIHKQNVSIMKLVFSHSSPLIKSSAPTTQTLGNGFNNANTLNNSGLMRRLFFLLQILAVPCLFAFTKPATNTSNEQINAGFSVAATALTVQTTTAEPVNVSWSEVPGVQNYCVVVTENGVAVQHSMVSGTTKTLNGLTSGHTYRCTVVGLANGSQVTDFIIALDIMP
jgi:hypothetical protein